MTVHIAEIPEQFKTERLDFRPAGPRDARDIFEGYASRPAATRWMDFVQHVDVSQSVAFAERCAGCWNDGSAYPWAIVERSSGHFAGLIELRLSPPEADFGYILCENMFGKGYATEAAKAVAEIVFSTLGVLRLWATCHPDNKASARVLEKAGLHYETKLPNWSVRPQISELASDSLMYAAVVSSG